MYRFIPINGPLFRRPFPAHVNFRPSKGPFILGLISRIRLVTFVTGLFRLWAKFSPWLQSACLWPVNPLGCFHSIIKYGVLTTRYGPRIVRPMIGKMMICPVEGPWILRPVEGAWIIWPVERPWIITARRRPMDPTSCRRPMDPTARRRPMVQKQWAF